MAPNEDVGGFSSLSNGVASVVPSSARLKCDILTATKLSSAGDFCVEQASADHHRR